jgi:hypothetical protein
MAWSLDRGAEKMQASETLLFAGGRRANFGGEAMRARGAASQPFALRYQNAGSEQPTDADKILIRRYAAADEVRR